VTAEVVDLAVVRGAYARAIPVEEYVAPMTLAEIEAEVAAIRAELVSPLQRLARLREAGAHLTAFGPSVTWHEAVERWLGDLSALRLSGSPEAVAERDALVRSLREQGATTRAIRDRLGISSYAVQQALAEHDPAPERIVVADGASRSSRGVRREALPAPTGRVYEQAAEYLRRAVDGLTLAELARVAGWSEGKASGALSDCVRRKGLATRSEALRGGMRVHHPVTAE
jgi:DNA-binding CsgD family transcriptional regulator